MDLPLVNVLHPPFMLYELEPLRRQRTSSPFISGDLLDGAPDLTLLGALTSHSLPRQVQIGRRVVF
jgi:hypothetical protein